MQIKDKKKKFLEKTQWVKDVVNKTIFEPQDILARIEALEQDVRTASPVQSKMKGFYESKNNELRDILNEATLCKQQRAKRSKRLLFLGVIPCIVLSLLANFPVDIVNKSLGSQGLFVYGVVIILMSSILYFCFFLYYTTFDIIRNRIIIPYVMYLHKNIKLIIYLIIGIAFIYSFFTIFSAFFIIESKLTYKDLFSSIRDFIGIFTQLITNTVFISIITILAFIMTAIPFIDWVKGKTTKKKTVH